MYPGLQTTADDLGQRGGSADLYGLDRQSAHCLVDGPQADQANLGDAPVLLSRLGLPGRSGSPFGETKTDRGQETGTQGPQGKSRIDDRLGRSTAPPGLLWDRSRCSVLRGDAIIP